ncbi:MAG: Sec-independent protein translocase subunit TatA/TatB [Planctomycetota bacterium]|jgi:sec-independent protein translocase protein TatA
MAPVEVAFLSLSIGEMLIIGVVALLVFGGRLPEVMRNLGRAYAKFRQGMTDMSRPIRDEMRRLDHEARTAVPKAVTEPPPGVYETGTDAVAGEAPAGDEAVEAGPEAGTVKSGDPPAPTSAPPAGGAADEPPPV